MAMMRFLPTWLCTTFFLRKLLAFSHISLSFVLLCLPTTFPLYTARISFACRLHTDQRDHIFTNHVLDINITVGLRDPFHLGLFVTEYLFYTKSNHMRSIHHKRYHNYNYLGEFFKSGILDGNPRKGCRSKINTIR